MTRQIEPLAPRQPTEKTKLSQIARRLRPQPISTGATAENDPIDLVHLSHQTLGEPTLEVELLRLFQHQTLTVDCSEFGNAPGDAGGRRRCDLLHLVKGSAHAIGAFGLAAAAESYEHALREGAPETLLLRRRQAFCEAAEAACRAAARLLPDE